MNLMSTRLCRRGSLDRRLYMEMKDLMLEMIGLDGASAGDGLGIGGFRRKCLGFGGICGIEVHG